MVKRDKFIKLRNKLKTDDRWAKNIGYYVMRADVSGIVVYGEKNIVGIAPKNGNEPYQHSSKLRF